MVVAREVFALAEALHGLALPLVEGLGDEDAHLDDEVSRAVAIALDGRQTLAAEAERLARLRARLNAYESLLCTAAGAVLSLAIGALGEVLDYRLCMTICGLTSMLVCWLTVFLRRHQVQQVLAARPNAAQSGEAQ